MLKTDFDPNESFNDNENMKDDENLRQVMELGNNYGIEENVKFSCWVNLRENFRIYKKITFIITNKKIYSFRYKKI
jgi:hypothetical protein